MDLSNMNFTSVARFVEEKAHKSVAREGKVRNTFNPYEDRYD